MEYYLLNRTHVEELAVIRDTLSKNRKGKDLSSFHFYFDKMIPKESFEPVFAVAMKHGTPMLIYSVHKEHKLTRGLSTVHLPLILGLSH